MDQNQTTSLDKSAAVETAGRELIDSALQRNRLTTLVANLALLLTSLLRGRRAKPAATVRKLKLKTYSYSPLPTGPRQHENAFDGTSKASRTHTEGRPNGVSAVQTSAGTQPTGAKAPRRSPRRFPTIANKGGR